MSQVHVGLAKEAQELLTVRRSEDKVSSRDTNSRRAAAHSDSSAS